MMNREPFALVPPRLVTDLRGKADPDAMVARAFEWHDALCTADATRHLDPMGRFMLMSAMDAGRMSDNGGIELPPGAKYATNYGAFLRRFPKGSPQPGERRGPVELIEDGIMSKSLEWFRVNRLCREVVLRGDNTLATIKKYDRNVVAVEIYKRVLEGGGTLPMQAIKTGIGITEKLAVDLIQHAVNNGLVEVYWSASPTRPGCQDRFLKAIYAAETRH